MSAGAFTREQARARFDAARDGELSEDERARFHAALAHDDELREEYEAWRSVLEAAGQLAPDAQGVDLLSGVQHKLRARSGGRFYRDRFAARRGTSTTLLVVLALSACFVLAVVCWFAFGVGSFDAP